MCVRQRDRLLGACERAAKLVGGTLGLPRACTSLVERNVGALALTANSGELSDACAMLLLSAG